MKLTQLNGKTFNDELNLTYVKHAQTLSQAPAQPLRTLSYLEQEARITNAHLYHPSFKSRIGFDLKETRNMHPSFLKVLRFNGSRLIIVYVNWF